MKCRGGAVNKYYDIFGKNVIFEIYRFFQQNYKRYQINFFT